MAAKKVKRVGPSKPTIKVYGKTTTSDGKKIPPRGVFIIGHEKVARKIRYSSQQINDMMRRSIARCSSAWKWLPTGVTIQFHTSGKTMGFARGAGSGPRAGISIVSFSTVLLSGFDQQAVEKVMAHELCHHYREERWPRQRTRQGGQREAHDDVFCKALSKIDPRAHDKKLCRYFAEERIQVEHDKRVKWNYKLGFIQIAKKRGHGVMLFWMPNKKSAWTPAEIVISDGEVAGLAARFPVSGLHHVKVVGGRVSNLADLLRWAAQTPARYPKVAAIVKKLPRVVARRKNPAEGEDEGIDWSFDEPTEPELKAWLKDQASVSSEFDYWHVKFSANESVWASTTRSDGQAQWVYRPTGDGKFERVDARDYLDRISTFGRYDDYFDVDLEEKFNEDFWSSPPVLFHGTRDIDGVLRGGIEARSETRGLGDQHVGDAVYTSQELEVAETYAHGEDAGVVKIDTKAMKRDRYMPTVAMEPEVLEQDQLSAIAHRLRMEWNIEYSTAGTYETTVVIFGNVPRKYLTEVSRGDHTKR